MISNLVKADMATRRFNVAHFLRNRGISYYEAGDNYMMNCPFCGDTRGRFGIHTRTKWNHCFNCNYSGTLMSFIVDLLGVSEDKAAEIILSNKSRATQLNLTRNELNIGPTVEYPNHFKALSYPITKENKRYWEYCTDKRKILSSVVLDYKIGYCTLGKYGYRVVIPVFWFDKLVTWVARDVTDKHSTKILTPNDNKQKDYLLNLDRLWGAEEVVLVEGPFDMLKVSDMAVASFGKTLSTRQISLLHHGGIKRVIVGYDNDAQAETWDTAKHLNEWFEVKVIDMPPGEDPGSLPEAHTRQLIREARPYSNTDYVKFKAGIL